jgi:hypothetical protein
MSTSRATRRAVAAMCPLPLYKTRRPRCAALRSPRMLLPGKKASRLPPRISAGVVIDLSRAGVLLEQADRVAARPATAPRPCQARRARHGSGGIPMTRSPGPAAAPPTGHHGAQAADPNGRAATGTASGGVRCHGASARSWQGDDQRHPGEAVDGQRPGEQGQPRPVRPCRLAGARGCSHRATAS